MKSRITGKPAEKKTIEEFVKELRALDEQEEFENKILEKIIESGKKEKVNSDEFYKHTHETECRYCMNYSFKEDCCKKNMPFINPWYAKDNGIFDECQEWDYVYILEDKEDE